MTVVPYQSSASASELRRSFDHSFAEARSPDAPPLDDFLAIRSGSEPYAIRLAHVARLVAGIWITPVPTVVPHLLGMAGLRGSVVPVYDLRSLLGCPASDAPAWLVLVAAHPIALAFDAFDGHLRLPHDAVVSGELSDTLHAPDGIRPIVNIPAVIDRITSSLPPRLSLKER